MTISGTGRINDFENGVTSAPWGDYELRKAITKVVINDGITHLGKNMLTRAWMNTIDASGCTTLVDTGNDLFKQKDYNYKNHNNNKKKKSEITICPKCHKYYPRNDEGYLTTINCECGLKAEFSPIKFEQTQYINLKKIKCDKCGKNKTEENVIIVVFVKMIFVKNVKQMSII